MFRNWIKNKTTASDSLIESVNKGTDGMCFLYAPGGTGKTFLVSSLLARIPCQNEVVLALVSSGIAGTLLEGGRTAHSAVKLPMKMQINFKPTCNIAKTAQWRRFNRYTNWSFGTNAQWPKRSHWRRWTGHWNIFVDIITLSVEPWFSCLFVFLSSYSTINCSWRTKRVLKIMKFVGACEETRIDD